MTDIAETQILDALASVIDSASGIDIVGAGMVSGLRVESGHVTFSIEVDPAQGAALETMRQAAESAVRQVKGVDKVTAVLTAERKPAAPAPHAHAHPHPPQSNPMPRQPIGRHANNRKIELPEIKAIVAVASGKGGVGKSTTAVNLALAMAKDGKRIGLLDADIYGPSLPRMMGIKTKPTQSEDGKINPIEAWGIKCVSMGMLVAEETPVIWRGPMATGALEQLMTDVAWGELDALVIDLPPGTGDIQLTLTQKLTLDGVVIVSTPNEIALIDARRAVAMFGKTATPILGMIENMAYFADASGAQVPIFGRGGAAAEARSMGVPLLAEVPIDMALRQAGDEGRPVTSGPAAEVFDRAAAVLMGKR